MTFQRKSFSFGEQVVECSSNTSETSSVDCSLLGGPRGALCVSVDIQGSPHTKGELGKYLPIRTLAIRLSGFSKILQLILACSATLKDLHPTRRGLMLIGFL